MISYNYILIAFPIKVKHGQFTLDHKGETNTPGIINESSLKIRNYSSENIDLLINLWKIANHMVAKCIIECHDVEEERFNIMEQCLMVEK